MAKRVSRREFFKATGGMAAGAGAAVGLLAVPGSASALNTRVTLPYRAQAIGKARGMKVDHPVEFTYPDAGSPCVALKVGGRAPGGVGPDGDIVAYSALCTHQGCPVAYDARERCLKCPCHFTIFDAEKGGQMVCGQAPTHLPRIILEYGAKDDTVTAVAVDGLIYGRQANIL